MKTNNDFSAHSAKGLGGASVRRAAMMLLMMLTTATAWANDYTVTYQAKFAYMGGLYNIILQRNDSSSLSATIAEKSSAWPGGTGVRVDDEYDITFTPSNNLYIATNPTTITAIGFNMSTGTTITASVANNSSYYIKQVKLLNQAATTGTSPDMAPNSRSATVTASGDIQFNFIEVCLTNDYYGTITPQNGLTLTATASLTYNSTNYYKSGTEITMNAPANRAIDAATGVSGASIAANKRSYTFAMPKQNVTPGATMSEVHTISCPSGLTVTSSPYCTDNTTKYYKKGETYTLTVDDANKVIQSFNASGADGSSVANDKKSATVTMGSSNVTVTATLQAISGTTTADGLSWSLAQDGSGNYTQLTISGSGAMTTYSHNTVDGLWRTNAPWGWQLTSVTIGDGVTSIGTQAFIGCQSLATVTLGSSVTSIGANAFDHCDALTQITLPSSVTTLNNAAFKNCSGLTRVDIQHDGAVSLGSNVFDGCDALQYIVFPSPAAVQANTTGNWSGLAEKRRAKFGNQHFGVTKDATNNAVYAIATDDDLRNLASAVNGGNDGSGKTFLQTADIDLGGSSNPFTPINYYRYFYGTYDGGSHTVSGLYIYAGNYSCVGLFGKVQNGIVRNVILISPDVTNTYNQSYDIRVGALIGSTELATVENCLVVSPTVNATGSGTKYIGALIGQTMNSTRVTNCSFYAGTGNASTGIGRRMDGTIGDVSRAYQVTLGSNVGLPNPPATGGFIAQGSHYYAQGATAQLSYTGSIPNGSRPVFTVSPDNTGATVTQQVVLTMGSADITITAKLSSTPLININTGTIADIPDQDYTGSAIVPDITLTVGDRVLTAGTDYTVSCTNNVAVGTATLTATGMGDYTGTLTKDFRICYADKTGSCGTNVTYTLHDEDQDGHYEQLTISGTGAMTDYAISDNVPWAAKRDDINSVTVQSGVTSIGARAFCYCSYLTSVSLPEGLTSIGDRAFSECWRLSALTVPTSVESVGYEAFSYLGRNTSGCILTFASGSRLTSVGYDAFYYAKASVDMSACTSLTSVPNAFWYFDGNVTFPRSLTSIAAGCFNHGESTTKVYIHVPDNYLLTVNNESVSATDGKADITSIIGVGTSHPAVTLSCIPNPTHFSQSGDEYTIHTATGWNIFCGILNDYAKGYFTGKTVRLGDNITVSRMAGSSNHDFTGTFDGNKMTLTVNYGTADSPVTENYAAPFRNVTTTKADPNDAADTPAAIRNLKVNGSIYTSAKYAAGIVANQYGTVNISNCSVSVRIHSSHSGDGIHGGLVAIQHNALTVEGCLFAGRLLTTNATTDCGGLVGYHSGGTCTISNCLYEPASFSTSENYINSGATFCRNWTMPADANCYYTQTLGDAQGKAPRSITAGEGVTISNIALTGSSEYYDVSGIRAYDNGGIKYNNTLYYGSGDQVSLTLTNSSGDAPLGYKNGDYSVSGGATFSGTTLTMADENVTVSFTPSDQLRSTGVAVPVSYINADGILCDGQDNHPAPASAIALDGTESDLNAGWYFVGADISRSGTIDCDGNANIILADGKTMSVSGGNKGINAGDGSLTIYGQTLGTGTLNATATATNGIGIYTDGIVTINGGTVNATGTSDVGIRGIDGVTINGGTVTTTGIMADGDVTISGGKFTATDDPGISSNSGNVILGWTSADDFITASSYLLGNSTGTVSIVDGQSFADAGGNIYTGTLSSDEVTAIAGEKLKPAKVMDPVPYIAGDGTTKNCYSYTLLESGDAQTLIGGWYVAQGTIDITGSLTLSGDVNIILADGAIVNIGTAQHRIGIGKCIYGIGKRLTIYGQTNQTGTLNAYKTSYDAAVYVKNYTQHGGHVTIDGENDYNLYLYDGTLTLTRGTLTVNGHDNTAIAMQYGTANVSGGTLNATGWRAIFVSNLALNGTATVTLTGSNYGIDGNLALSGGSLTATATNGDGIGIRGNVTLAWNSATDRFTATTVTGTVTIADGKSFHNGSEVLASGTVSDKDKVNGKTLRPFKAITLADNADNSGAINEWNGGVAHVTISGRKLWKDGAWNTLCLPFGVTIAGSVLDGTGVEARTLTEASISGTTLNLTFGDAVTTLTAGVPYIIKWTKDEVNPTIDDPVFSGVTIDATDRSFTSGSGDEQVRFIGTYDQKTIPNEDKSILFLGAGNNLYYPDGTNGGVTIGACRAYFKIGEDETQARQLTAFNIDFGDETNAVFDLNNKEEITNNNWYTLDGVKLDGQPTKKGLYIHGGRKVVVK